MPRPIWSGSISFGLVSVPVKLFSATSPKEVHFNMLHDKDGARIQQKRVCSVDGKEVPWEHIVKGFEISKGRYVMVTREELESFNPRATKAIEIEDFVDLTQIDPIYYESTYYLLPDKGASKPYALLERKAEGEEIVAQEPEEEPRGKVVNLMDALQKSLAAAQRGEIRHKPEPERRTAARTARAPKHKARARKARR